MAQMDPLGIRETGTTVGPDGLRANEKVTRNYMQFGKLSFFNDIEKKHPKVLSFPLNPFKLLVVSTFFLRFGCKR